MAETIIVGLLCLLAIYGIKGVLNAAARLYAMAGAQSRENLHLLKMTTDLFQIESERRLAVGAVEVTLDTLRPVALAARAIHPGIEDDAMLITDDGMATNLTPRHLRAAAELFERIEMLSKTDLFTRQLGSLQPVKD